MPLLEETELPVLKAVLAWKLLRNSALYLSSKYIDLMVEFNADLYGVSEKNPRARKCYYSVQSSTPWPMAKLYVGVSSFPFRERECRESEGNVVSVHTAHARGGAVLHMCCTHTRRLAMHAALTLEPCRKLAHPRAP